MVKRRHARFGTSAALVESRRLSAMRDSGACVTSGAVNYQRNVAAAATKHPHFKLPHIFTVTSEDKTMKGTVTRLSAIEWMNKNHCRLVALSLTKSHPRLAVEKPRGGLLRRLDFELVGGVLAFQSHVETSGRTAPFLLLSPPTDYSLVLRFDDEVCLGKFLHVLGAVLREHGKALTVRTVSDDELLAMAETKETRQEKLDHFFREAYAARFKFPRMHDEETAAGGRYVLSSVGGTTGSAALTEEVLSTRLTQAEFADSIGMCEEDLFVRRMFACITTRRDNRDTVSFQDFLEVVRRFSNGDVKEKIDVIFDMIDVEHNGTVEREEFFHFVRSIGLAAGVGIGESEQKGLVDSILDKWIQPNKSSLTRDDFAAVFAEVANTGRPIGIHFRGTHQKVSLEETQSLQSFVIEEDNAWIGSWFQSSWLSNLVSVLEKKRQQIAFVVIYFLFTFAFFIERYWHYRHEHEHGDVRRVMGVGIAITRGAAASISFSFGVILLTVCRNVMTLLRQTPLKNYVPFDSHIAFHKIVALTGLFFSVLHTVGHCVNFYHVTTQSREGLHCLFQEAVFSSNFQPSIAYWLYGTITGITGVLLVVLMSVIYVFAAPSVINNAYHAFRLTHFLNILFYVLTIAHGLAKLTDKPKFMVFIAGPVVVYVIDRILALRQDFRQLQIISARLLPSDIFYVEFKRPANFRFYSGQWVRTSCPAFTCHFNERHAFSLASSPGQSTLKMYIKAVGPWTYKLRDEIQSSQDTASPYPVLHMDGPYGAGNQEWSSFEVAVLIGGGIGVTPYASILHDLVREIRGRPDKFTTVVCKKVYFIWVAPSHKHFEWFVEVLREVEREDEEGVLDVHIFITQFFHKFDLRSTILYICEKHFRGESGKSIFTNLKATNHFGRPKFENLLKYVQSKHDDQKHIGVFSCGPRSMNQSIQGAVTQVNRNRDAACFVHRHETF